MEAVWAREDKGKRRRAWMELTREPWASAAAAAGVLGTERWGDQVSEGAHNRWLCPQGGEEEDRSQTARENK